MVFGLRVVVRFLGVGVVVLVVVEGDSAEFLEFVDLVAEVDLFLGVGVGVSFSVSDFLVFFVVVDLGVVLDLEVVVDLGVVLDLEVVFDVEVVVLVALDVATLGSALVALDVAAFGSAFFVAAFLDDTFETLFPPDDESDADASFLAPKVLFKS